MLILNILGELILALVIFLFIAIKSSAFQTWLAKRVTAYLSAELNTTVTIDKVDIDFFDYLTLHGVYVEDLHRDTLLYVQKIECKIDDFSIDKDFLHLKYAKLINPGINIIKYKGENDFNYEFIEDYFSSPKKDTDTASDFFDLRIKKILITGGNLTYANLNKNKLNKGIDFNHLYTRKLNIQLENFKQIDDTIYFNIKNTGLREQSGFILDTLTAKFSYSPVSMKFDSLRIKTPYSDIITEYLHFNYNHPDDFDSFEELVTLNCNFYYSKVSLDDIAYFANELWGINRTVLLKSKVKGTIANLKLKKTELYLSEKTFFKGNVSIDGLPDTENAFINAMIEDFQTNKTEIENFDLPPFDGSEKIVLPDNLNKLGDIKLTGNFTGTPEDFVAFAKINTRVGIIRTDMHFYVDQKTNKFKYTGDLSVDNFNLGYLYNLTELGNISLNATLTAQGLNAKDIHANIKADISHLQAHGYDYHKIKLKGIFQQNLFNGNLIIDDPNICMSYNGNIDFSKKIPEYDFGLIVENAYLHRLKFINGDDLSRISFNIHAKATGNNIDNLFGKLYINNIFYHEKGRNYDFENISINSYKNQNLRSLVIDSQPFTLNVTGDFTFEELPNSFLSMSAQILPSLFEGKYKKSNVTEDFTYSLKLNNLQQVSELFFPDLYISPDALLTGEYHSVTSNFSINFKTQKISTGDIHINAIDFASKKDADKVILLLSSNYIELSEQINFKQMNITANTQHDSITGVVSWGNDDKINSALITLSGHIKNDKEAILNIMPSDIYINNEKWSIAKTTHIEMNDKNYFINNFIINHQNESLSIFGNISENRNELLNFKIDNFNLQHLKPLLGNEHNLQGIVNGEGYFADIYHNMVFANKLNIDTLIYNQELIGNVKVVNLYNHANNSINSIGDIIRVNTPTLKFSGDYFIENSQINYKINLEKTNLVVLNAFLPQDVSNLRGLASGNINIKGNTREPRISGLINITNGAINVNMLNVEYYFGGEISFSRNIINFNKLTISDIRGNLGKGFATIFHENYENLDIIAHIDFNNLLLLNTNEEYEKDGFWGRVFGSGEIFVQSSKNETILKINLKTERGTKFYLPSYNTAEEEIQDFVRFVSNNDTLKPIKQKNDLTFLTLDIALNVTPDAEVNLLLNRYSDDAIRAKGTGLLNMEIDPFGEFKMYGTYTVSQGDYKFTMMNLINKNFIVKSGSYINWYGDPYSAEMNITAKYKVQTPVFLIMPSDVAERYRNNRQVECLMNLKDNLFKPTIKFDINIPNSDENIKNALNIIRSSEQERNKQFFSLLAFNRFMPLTSSIDNSSIGVAGGNATYSELVSSLASSALSNMTDFVNIGLNYKKGDQLAQDEVALDLSKQLFNDRVSITGNIGLTTARNNTRNSNRGFGEVNVEYKVNRDGTFRLRGFYESNQQTITNTSQSPYTQGAGVYYTEEFDKFWSDTKIGRFISSIFRRKNRTDKLYFDHSSDNTDYQNEIKHEIKNEQKEGEYNGD